MELAKGMHILSDDDLSQICGGVNVYQAIEFSSGLLVGPIKKVIHGFTTPIYLEGTSHKSTNAGIMVSYTATKLLIAYLSYRGLKAIFSKSSPSCNSKDDKKIETDETKSKEQSACA